MFKCVRWCFALSDELLKARSHARCWQAYGRSPVCERMWIFKFSSRENVLSHPSCCRKKYKNQTSQQAAIQVFSVPLFLKTRTEQTTWSKLNWTEISLQFSCVYKTKLEWNKMPVQLFTKGVSLFQFRSFRRVCTKQIQFSCFFCTQFYGF